MPQPTVEVERPRSGASANDELSRVARILKHAGSSEGYSDDYSAPYGNLLELNSARTILDSIGQSVLTDLVGDYLSLLESSAAVYERNGDYALGIFSSGWCRFMDAASRALCGTDDNEEALASGKWHCHESCWSDASRESMKQGGPVDIACKGGIRLHAIPIRANGEIVGSINFGYGDPPKDPARLQELADLYEVDVAELTKLAENYESRPDYIIELAKKRLRTAAAIIGEMIERNMVEEALRESEERIGRMNEELEERVYLRTKELEQSNAELQSFAYSVSHDLRAPLRAMTGLSEALIEDYGPALDEQAHRYLERVTAASEKMGELIDDLLELSRVGRSDLHREEIDVKGLIEEIIAERLNEVGEEVRWEIEEGLVVDGDPSLMRVALGNLLENGFKFSRGNPHPTVTVSSERRVDGRAWIVIEDNGVGFDPAFAGNLFRPFHRLHSEHEFIGTGIGLATVKRIIDKHSGSIEAEGRPGRGATFRFTTQEAAR